MSQQMHRQGKNVVKAEFSAMGFARCVLLLATLIATNEAVASPSSFIASVDQQSGLPILARGGAVALSSKFVFWGKNWAWAGLSTKFDVIGPYLYSILGNSPPLDFTLDGRIKKQADRQFVWEFDLNARSGKADVIGGGISFNLNLAGFGSELGQPELLPDNSGWNWGDADHRIEMRFDPPLPAVYFERGQKSEIRAFFYKGEIPEGKQHYIATLSISGDIVLGSSIPEQFGIDDERQWPTGILDWAMAPVDLSFLNQTEKPAGKHGFLNAVKDKLVFEDGTPVRFWGTNITAYTLFGTSQVNVQRQAHRLSELGFNLVRIHHHDSEWVVPNIFGGKGAADTKTLSSEMLSKIDWWIKCLEDEGIYVWLDLHVGRQLKSGDDIEAFSEISKGKPSVDPRGYNYVNASIQQAMQRFNEQYLEHRNGFNGLAYKGDPGIAVILLTNEDDLTFHFGNRLLPNQNVLQHNAWYMSAAQAFATKFGLPKEKTWRSWEQGPSKLFLNDLEHQFDVNMIGQLKQIGVKVPIVTTSFWGNIEPISSLPALLTGDIVDVHSYGTVDELKANPLYAANYADWIAVAHVVDRPLTISEWNVSRFPVPDRHAAPIYIASVASYQGWAGALQFAYSVQALNGATGAANWDATNDPGMIATLPAAALLFRRGDVQEAKRTFVFAPTQDQLTNQLISPATSVALRTAFEKGKLLIAMPKVPQLSWLEPSSIPAGSQIITDPSLSLIGRDETNAVSDTGELRHDWQRGIYTIDTSRSQGATGWIGGEQVHLANVDIAVSTRNASVIVESLDKNSLSDSRRIEISLGARSIPDSKNQTVSYSEPVVGHLAIRAGPGLRLYKLLPGSTRQQQLPLTYEAGRYDISLDQTTGTYWLELR
jgi:hypothetical protein